MAAEAATEVTVVAINGRHAEVRAAAIRNPDGVAVVTPATTLDARSVRELTLKIHVTDAVTNEATVRAVVDAFAGDRVAIEVGASAAETTVTATVAAEAAVETLGLSARSGDGHDEGRETDFECVRDFHLKDSLYKARILPSS